MRSRLIADEPAICTVTDLTFAIKDQLEGCFNLVTLGGEISNFTQAGSGHWYFNVKDAEACIRAVVWRSTVQRLRVKLKDGMQIVGRGKLSVYPPRGEYQLVFDDIHAQGLGAQDLALRQLKEKLHKLGWFAAERKKPLPKFPRCIAIASSPSGAAIRDMIEILCRRWPHAEIYVCPIRVQGDGAPQTIVHALRRLNKLHRVEVILLGRGGGSSDDLAAFNDERVAKAIHDSRIPIISAVGHEIDLTIADMVADRRALTPSEAAELAAPDCKDVLESLVRHHRRFNDLLQHRFCYLRQRMSDLVSRRCFRSPLETIRDRERKLDDLRQRMDRAVKAKVVAAEQKLQHAAARLQALSPLNVLARGYSLTRSADGHVIHSAAQTKPGEPIEILLADGTLTATVETTTPGAAP